MLGETRRLDPELACGGGSIAPVLPDVIVRSLPGGSQAKAGRGLVQAPGVLQRTCVHRTIDSIFSEPLTPIGEPPNASSDFVTPRAQALRVGHSAKPRLGELAAARIHDEFLKCLSLRREER